MTNLFDIIILVAITGIFFYFKSLAKGYGEKEGELKAELDIIKNRSNEILSHTKDLEKTKATVWKEKEQWKLKQQIYLELMENLTSLSIIFGEAAIICKNEEKDNLNRISSEMLKLIKEFAKLTVYAKLILNNKTQAMIHKLAIEMDNIKNKETTEGYNEQADMCITLASDITLLAKQDLLP